MTSDTTVFGRFDALFQRRAAEATYDGRGGSLVIRSIPLADGDRLRCATEDDRVYWYEVVFNDDGRPMRIARDTDLTLGDMEILESLLRENQA